MKEFIKKIERINFGLMSPEDIRKMSVVRVETPDTYDSDGYPIENGLMDPRLGVLDPSLRCHTCGVRGGDCQGHFGSIELARPVLHVGFGDIIHKILRSTCNECGRVLLPEDVLEDYREKLAEAIENRENLEDILKKIQGDAKKVEMPETKQNDIVDKIMDELYPEENDTYDHIDRRDALLKILNQLYAEAYMKRDESEEKASFKYIDPKQLCPHCRKNQSLEDIEASYDMIEAKSNDELDQLEENIRNGIESDFDKKLEKVDKKIEELQNAEEIDDDAINKAEEEKQKILDDIESKSERKFDTEFKRRIRDYLKETIQGYVQEPILLDKPVTIHQGEYKLTASEIRERLERITDEDIYILGINPEVARPEWLVLTVLPVPPVTVRPSITLDTGERSEDDLTHKLVDILRINQRLVENMEAGAPQLIVEDLWDLLQYHVTTYFDNEASGVPPSKHRSGRPLKTLTQRLKGKEGRFRSNLSGKRVNFSARTVISPDPNISINEVGVPEMIAKEVTVPAYVNDWNIDEIKTYVENGPDVHPGANYMITESGSRRKINEDTKEFILENLKPGDIVERHLKDGDMVLFNRQPSLHRMSMMAHEVRVLPYKTFRLNLCVCPPYNADFDGDEMNMHVFQTDESRAEAKSLMRVQEHILSPRFGGPIIGAIHDHISGAYLLTRKSMKFPEEQALQIVRKSHLPIPENDGEKWLLKKSESGNDVAIEKEIAKRTKNVRGTKADKEAYLNTLGLSEDEIAKRLKANKWNDEEKEIIKSIAHKRISDEITAKYSSDNDDGIDDSIIEKANGEEWTGKELFSLLLPNDLNLTYKAEICTKCGQCDKILREAPDPTVVDYEHICPIDAYVMIENGILKHGVIDEKAYGSMSGQILDKIVKEYGPGRAKEFLDRSTDLAICGIMVTGITTSLNDEEIPEEAQARINEHLQKSEEKVDRLIDAYNEGILDALPGRSLEETLEMRIMQVLGEARDKSGEIAEDYLTMEHNHSVVMARTGARASMLNLTQITSCVGQQAVRGGRIHRGYIERTLPHFKRNELGAKAKGFVHSSYKSGLDPIEFFFHAMGGREGLVDTAIRTAQSGYMQRRLVNALQDLQVKPSGLVTDNQSNVVQRIFGDDGVDPAKSDFGIAANLDKLIEEIKLEEKSNEVSQEGK
ncbi:MAG: DNA-directed RNA polymerase subunit A' [Methanobrevibacter sp.]|uniref:DNA-directed RNA polymerase subunit A' n=1 Tax=Methanobrevibacter sp. TaxID=66852 RepID=UPI0025EA3BF3|nr:DNA-directed RNA polymerase subunit A' [Methanobrevibacter sp.]MBR0272001.1 DNA-directed RNA polymerase subunit A' [Methanobrevibacter sp.]